MHNLDRSQLEGDFYETEQYEFGYQGESPFSEAEEMEMAAHLLEITDEAELDQFLGGLFRKVGRAAGQFIKSPVGQALGGVLKNVAKQALPVVGSALGSMVAPGVGTAIGGQLGSLAGQAFGLELEGLSQEDQEFEVAKSYVRLAGAAARNAAQMPANISPQQAAKAAFTEAAKQVAPGLLGQPAAGPYQTGMPQTRNSGRWIRRGNKIILLGV